MSIYQYIVDYGLVLIPVLLLVGIVLKKLPFVPSCIIPSLIFILGIIGGFFIFGLNFFGFMQGFVCAGCAIGLHQLWKKFYECRYSDCDSCEPDIYEEDGDL